MAGNDSFVIVVGVDGSEQSLAALEWAITEARLRQGRIRVITAWYYPALASEVGDGVIDESFKHAAEQVQARALSLVADAGVPVTGQVVENSPATALLHAAREVEPVHLADHGVAGDTRTQPPGDLAGAQALRPELLQELHALICPGQFRPS